MPPTIKTDAELEQIPRRVLKLSLVWFVAVSVFVYRILSMTEHVRKLLDYAERKTITNPQTLQLIRFRYHAIFWECCLLTLPERETILYLVGKEETKDRRRTLSLSIKECGARQVGDEAQRKKRTIRFTAVDPKQSPQDRNGAKSDQWGDYSRGRAVGVK